GKKEEKYKAFKKTTIVGNYGNIANIYLEMGDYKKAINILKKMIGMLKGERKSALANTYLNLGVCYTRIEDFTRAITYFNLGIEIAVEINDTLLEANGLSNLSNSLSIFAPVISTKSFC
ncbi:MAG: tetratricopeptide repeat protein, partial [Sphingobacteriales bacterium]